MKLRKVKSVKVNGTESTVKCSEIKCLTYEKQDCCQLIRKIEATCWKEFNPCVHRNTLLRKKWDFHHYRKSDDGWTLARNLSVEETFTSCLQCNPVINMM
jgi:hypothetical protein